MHRAISQFRENFIRIDRIDAAFLYLTEHVRISLDDAGDILRSQIVYAVSALDKLIHELVRIGMREAFLGRRIATPAFQRFEITLEQYDNLRSSTFPPPEAVFDKIVTNAHGYLAFQDPGKVSEALNLIWPEAQKWQVIGTRLGMAADDVKVRLKNIVIRRNQIVHECDLDLSTGAPQLISQTDARESVQFMKNLGFCIFELVSL